MFARHTELQRWSPLRHAVQKRSFLWILCAIILLLLFYYYCWFPIRRMVTLALAVFCIYSFYHYSSNLWDEQQWSAKFLWMFVTWMLLAGLFRTNLSNFFILQNLTVHFYEKTRSYTTDCVLVRHTRLTHSYLIEHTDPPKCTNCNQLLSIKHILTECTSYNQARHQYYSFTDIKKILSLTPSQNILNFI